MAARDPFARSATMHPIFDVLGRVAKCRDANYFKERGTPIILAAQEGILTKNSLRMRKTTQKKMQKAQKIRRKSST